MTDINVDSGDIVTPGTALLACVGCTEVSGIGTYIKGDILYASVVGQVQIDPETGLVSVLAAKQAHQVVPVLESIVTCKITNVNSRMAQAVIVCVGSKSIAESGFRGVIRKDNVRSFEIDRVLMHESFRPGDIVRAKVVSMGTARSYELSTAENSLGVISALSDTAQAPLVSISWDQMKCPVTHIIEKRKVAKLE